MVINHRENTKDFLKAYCLTALLAILPVILFVPRYVDDYGRSTEGYFNWTKEGFRPLADVIYYIFNLGKPATALAPLAQLLSVPVAGLAALALSRAFGIRSILLAILVTLPLFVNPYFIENLSYGFDCLSMTMAVALAALSATQAHNALQRPRLLVIALMLFCSLLLYQPAFGAYFPLAIAVLAWRWTSSKDHNQKLISTKSLITLTSAIGAAVFSLVAFQAATFLFCKKRLDYSNDLTKIKFSQELFSVIKENINTYIQAINNAWSHTAFAPAFIAIAICFVVVLGRRLTTKIKSKWAFPIAVLIALILFLAAPGPLYILPVDLNIPRMNAYFGGLICSFTLPIGGYVSELPKSNHWRIAATTILIIWTWCVFVFIYAYGHAMQAQREYEHGAISRLVGSISSLDPTRQARYVHFDGEMRSSPVLSNTAKKFPLINNLVPRMINGGWVGWARWGSKQLAYYGLDLKGVDETRKDRSGDNAKDKTCTNSKDTRCTSEYNIVLHSRDHLSIQMK